MNLEQTKADLATVRSGIEAHSGVTADPMLAAMGRLCVDFGDLVVRAESGVLAEEHAARDTDAAPPAEAITLDELPEASAPLHIEGVPT